MLAECKTSSWELLCEFFTIAYFHATRVLGAKQYSELDEEATAHYDKALKAYLKEHNPFKKPKN